jgi:hypothetical protein
MALDPSLWIRDLGRQALQAETMPDKLQTKLYESRHKLRRSLPKHPSMFFCSLLIRVHLELSSFEIAQRLQVEEEEYERRRVAAEERRRREANGRQPVYAPQYQHSQQPPASQMGDLRISQQQVTADELASGGRKIKKDKDCVIM